MSALIALFNTEDDALVESVFVDSCIDLVSNLGDEDIEKINEYITLLDNKQTKGSLEQEISEALVMFMEHNAALYGTFLYESTDEEIDPESAKTMLENIRSAFGREFVMEALSDKAKSRLKTAGKVGLGVGAAGVAAWQAHKHGDEIKTSAKKALSGVKGMFKNNSVSSGEQARTDNLSSNPVSSGEAARTGNYGKSVSGTRGKNAAETIKRQMTGLKPKTVGSYDTGH